MTTIKFRRDTSANWTSVNPIPAQGEPCYETDTGKLKIGNGSDNYTTLPYVSDGGGSSGDLPIATATTLGGVKIGNNLSITEDGTLSANAGTTGTTDYTQLENKPQINSIELTGNKTLNDLGIQPKGNYLTALPDNAVTTNTQQTITGIKNFTSSVSVKNASDIKLYGGKLSLHSDSEGNTYPYYLGRSGNTLTVRSGMLRSTTHTSFRIEDRNTDTLFEVNSGSGVVFFDTTGEAHNLFNDGNMSNYIDTTYMKWDTAKNKLTVDTAAVAHLAMPSNTNVNLTLGASGATYTAPADGYVCVGFFGNTGGNFEILAQVSNSVSYVTGAARCQCPVLKGNFSCWYSKILNNKDFVFYFNYAVGTVPTNV